MSRGLGRIQQAVKAELDVWPSFSAREAAYAAYEVTEVTEAHIEAARRALEGLVTRGVLERYRQPLDRDGRFCIRYRRPRT